MKRLSKSQYVKGRKCIKRVWLYNYRKELAKEPSPFQEGILEQGREVGVRAQKRYPEGELIEEDFTNPEGALAHTKKLLEEGKKTIFEAAFLHDNILVRVDILKNNDDGSYDLIEVKSSTKAKPENKHDLAIQKYVLKGSGLNLRSTHLLHIDNQYVFNGTEDLNALFIDKPMDGEIKQELAEIPDYIAKIQSALEKQEEPKAPIGAVCKNPYECEFKEYCWKDVSKDSIHYLYNIRDPKRRELEKAGIKRIQDISEKTKLSDPQKVEVKAAKEQRPIINQNQIKKHLKKLKYPRYFLDFEFLGFAIPKYPNTSPYQKLAFQFSLHIKEKPESTLEHYEYLHEKDSDPQEPLIQELLKRIGEKGSIIVYHQTAESEVIKSLAKSYPKYQNALKKLKERLWDLETPFAKRNYCDPKFKNSSSIKKVLPILIPNQTYKNLDIQSGTEAPEQYIEMIKPNTPKEKRHQIAKNLKEYCHLDTMAMVEILQFLESKQDSSAKQ